MWEEDAAGAGRRLPAGEMLEELGRGGMAGQ